MAAACLGALTGERHEEAGQTLRAMARGAGT
jgi:hypothetical protein